MAIQEANPEDFGLGTTAHLVEPGERPTLGQVIAGMGRTVVTGDAEEFERAITPNSAEALARAFDRGAQLSIPDAPSSFYPTDSAPASEPRRPGAKRTPRRPEGAENLEGLFATGFILVITFTIGEWALPTAEEASAIAAPLGNILARRIDLATKLGRNSNDVIALAIALMSYSARVGPIAVERARDGINEYRVRRNAVSRRGIADRSSDSNGAGSVVAGETLGERTGHLPSSPTLDAFAKARNAGLGYLDRDIGSGQGSVAPVAD